MPPSRPEIADRTFAHEAGVRPLSAQKHREALTESPAVEAKAAARMRKAPRSAVVVCILAETQAFQNRSEEAIASYRSAITLDSHYAEAYGDAGRVHARQPIASASVKGWRKFEAELKPMIDTLRRGGHVID